MSPTCPPPVVQKNRVASYRRVSRGVNKRGRAPHCGDFVIPIRDGHTKARGIYLELCKQRINGSEFSDLFGFVRCGAQIALFLLEFMCRLY